MGARLDRLLLAAVVAAVANAAPATAATFELHQSGQLLRLSGELKRNDARSFRELMERDGGRVHTIYLDSPGGSLADGLRIGELIRARNLATRVPAKAECASACVFILAGGRVREVEQGGKVGVHMASALSSDEYVARLKKVLLDRELEIDDRIRVIIAISEQMAAKAAGAQATYLTRMGISLRLLQPNFETNHFDIYWLSPQELADYNLVNAR